jgi:hypothetical protein
MSITFLQLAQRVLSESEKPLSVEQIWQIAMDKKYSDELNSIGKTPLHTLGAQLYVNVKTGSSSIFAAVGSRPKCFYLKEKESHIQFEAHAEEDKKLTGKVSFQEKQLHPFLAYFAQYELEAFTKTINHSKSSKSSFGQWMHPDMVGCYFPEWKSATKELSQALGHSSVKIFSFELKRDLSFSNLRESFFQAVSNSSWANEGYLAAAQISQDREFQNELERLSESFGIGVIQIDISDPDSTKILFPSREREIDWESANKICELNPDFESFLQRVKIDFTSNVRHQKEYDDVLTTEELRASLLASSSL